MQPERVEVAWSAPGRVNLIGEHLDYNGGPVLPFALDLSTTATIRPQSQPGLQVRSEGHPEVSVAPALDPEQTAGWARYVAGSVWAFSEHTGPLRHGLDIEITSSLPVGAGLSSSAALECAVLCALDEIAGTGLTREQVAMLALRAEREFVGVPCGPMDQLAVMLGQRDHALLIDTRTLLTEPVPLLLSPSGLAILVIDTRVRHLVGDSGYADRRAACEQAAAHLGVEALADASADAAEGLADPVLRRRARHVVSEVHRVIEAVGALRSGRVADIGPLLTDSHRSLADDFDVSCPELDAAVEAALTSGALGARMTGAGFGGSAIALCHAGDVTRVTSEILGRFAASGWAAPRIWPVRPADGARRRSRRR